MMYKILQELTYFTLLSTTSNSTKRPRSRKKNVVFDEVLVICAPLAPNTEGSEAPGCVEGGGNSGTSEKFSAQRVLFGKINNDVCLIFW